MKIVKYWVGGYGDGEDSSIDLFLFSYLDFLGRCDMGNGDMYEII